MRRRQVYAMRDAAEREAQKPRLVTKVEAKTDDAVGHLIEARARQEMNRYRGKRGRG